MIFWIRWIIVKWDDELRCLYITVPRLPSTAAQHTAATMATSPMLFLVSLLLVLVAAATGDEASPSNAAAPAAPVLVGGRTEIRDVGSNKAVQSLGRFAVAEHNRRLRHGAPAARRPVSEARVRTRRGGAEAGRLRRGLLPQGRREREGPPRRRRRRRWPGVRRRGGGEGLAQIQGARLLHACFFYQIIMLKYMY